MTDLTVLRTSITLGLLVPALTATAGVVDLTADDETLGRWGVCRYVGEPSIDVVALRRESQGSGLGVYEFGTASLAPPPLARQGYDANDPSSSAMALLAVRLRDDAITAALDGSRELVRRGLGAVETGAASLARLVPVEPQLPEPTDRLLVTAERLGVEAAEMTRRLGLAYRDLATRTLASLVSPARPTRLADAAPKHRH